MKCSRYRELEDFGFCQDYVQEDCVDGKTVYELCPWHGKGDLNLNVPTLLPKPIQLNGDNHRRLETT